MSDLTIVPTPVLRRMFTAIKSLKEQASDDPVVTETCRAELESIFNELLRRDRTRISHEEAIAWNEAFDYFTHKEN